jgi:hypothetical protein
VTSPDEDGLVYPNPGSVKVWMDADGCVWERRGRVSDRLDEKRVRTLLRRAGVPLATWAAGVIEWAHTPDAKATAAERLYSGAARPDDVVASEWKSTEGTVLLLLEHYC